MFYSLEDFDVANYADYIEFVVNNLEHLSPILFTWLNDYGCSNVAKLFEKQLYFLRKKYV